MKWYGFGLLALAMVPAAARTSLAAGMKQPASSMAQPVPQVYLCLYGNGGGHGPQGYLGIDVRDVSESSMGALRLKDTRGAEIIHVDHDGPAGKMGLREHDVVLQMNGVAIAGEEPLRRMLRETVPGKTVTFVISRDGQQMTTTAIMGDRDEVEREAFELHLASPQAPSSGLPAGDGFPATAAAPASPPGLISRYSKSFLPSFLITPTYTGLMLESMGPQLAQFFAVPGGAGLLVRSVEQNSPAAMAGLKAGDIVTKTNFQPVGSPGHWSKMVKEAKGRPITVTVLRDRQERTMTLVPDSRKHSELLLPALSPPGLAIESVLWLRGRVEAVSHGEL